MRLGRDGSEAHRAGGEPLDDLGDRLDLLDRHRRADTIFELHQATQRSDPLALVIDQSGVFLEDRVLAGAGGVLQFEDRIRIEQVVLAFAAPLVLPADLEFAVRALVGPVQIGQLMAVGDVGGDVIEVDTADRAAQSGEVFVEHALGYPDGLEQLRSGVRRHRRDAHLRHDLQDTLAGGLDVVVQRLVAVDTGDNLPVDHVADGLEGHIGIDRRGAERDQHRHVVHLTGITGLDDHPDLGAGSFPDQMVVHGRHREQRRDGRHGGIGLPVGQDQDPGAAGDRPRHLGADVVQRAAQAGPALGHRVEAADHGGTHAVPMAVDLVVRVEVDQLGQFVVPQDRLRQQDLVARLAGRVQQIALGTEGGRQAGDDLLADAVQRRVGHLGEQLLEVVVEHPRTGRQHRDGSVAAHRAQRLLSGAGHRRHQQVEFLVGVAESLLAQHDPVVRHPDVGTLRKVVEVELLGLQPLGVGVCACQFALDLLVGDDPALGGVHQEHPTGLQAHALDHPGRVEVEDAGLRGHDDQSVVGDPDAGRAKAVAVEHRTHQRAVGEHHRCGTVPRFHQRGVVGVESAARGVHTLVALPGLRDHHQHRVRQAVAAQVQQFEHLVEASAVRGARSADREDLLHVRAEHVGFDERLTGPHPVLVAGDGVDLAVVGDAAERVGQRPGRKGVGGEPRVNHAQRALHPLVLQVQVEGLQLRGGQHALIDQSSTGKAWEIDGFTARAVLPGALGAQLVLGAFAHHVGLALEVDPRGAADEELAEGRHRVAGQRTQRRVVGGHITPAEHGQAFGLDDLLQCLARQHGVAGRLRQEGDAGGVRALVGQVEVHHRAQEAVRNLNHDARTVAAVMFGAGGTAVLQIQQSGDGLVDDVAAATAVDVDDHGHATRIVFVDRVVEPDTTGHKAPHPSLARRFNDGAPGPSGFLRASVNGGPSSGVNRYQNDMHAAPNMPTQVDLSPPSVHGR